MVVRSRVTAAIPTKYMYHMVLKYIKHAGGTWGLLDDNGQHILLLFFGYPEGVVKETDSRLGGDKGREEAEKEKYF